MKFEKIVSKINTHWLTQSDLWFDIILSKWPWPWRYFTQQSAATWWMETMSTQHPCSIDRQFLIYSTFILGKEKVQQVRMSILLSCCSYWGDTLQKRLSLCHLKSGWGNAKCQKGWVWPGVSPGVLNLKIFFSVSSVSGVWVDSVANLDFWAKQ